MKLAIIVSIIFITTACNGHILQSLSSALTNAAKLVQTKDRSSVLCFHCEEPPQTEWYTNAVFYQIYPRTFMDSDNDGNGDLKGIRSRLSHLVELGVDGVWLSPVFKSPQVDGGYDIESFYEIDEIYGTMDDMLDLILECKRMGIRLILDFVPNHTSDKHEWFINSEKQVPPYEDFYVWVDGVDCLPEAEWDPESEEAPCKPPNNWVSVFFGPMWQWSWERKQFYLHQFTKEQPDLNFWNPVVREELNAVLEYWMERGVDGFRVDAINHAIEAEGFPDEYVKPGGDPTNWNDIYHNYTMDQPESYELVYTFRDTLDRFALIRGVSPRILMTEAYPVHPENVFGWYGNGDRLGSQIAFNFIFISDLNEKSTVKEFSEKINFWLEHVPEGASPNWVMGNHDRSRLVTRYGKDRAQAMAFLEFTLPGYAIVYNGEEIGMENNMAISWEETQDPQACNTNSSVFIDYSRDPVRTPFQWDATINAGFNKGAKPWLPVHSNYRDLNLAAQKGNDNSMYNMYRNLIKLRKEPVYQLGHTMVHAFEDEHVLVVLRSNGDDHYATVINFSEEDTSVDLTTLTEETNSLPQAMLIYASNSYHPPHTFADDEGHEHDAHEVVNAKDFKLGKYDAVIVKLGLYTSSAATLTVSIGVMLLTFVRFFLP